MTKNNNEQKFTESQSFNADVNTLLQHINRLGNALRGRNSELDHKLAKVRVLSRSHPNIERLRPLFDDIQQLLTKESVTSTDDSLAPVTELNDHELTDVQEQLANLLSVIEFPGAISHSLHGLRQRLLTAQTAPELMQNSIEALALLIRGIHSERGAAEEFLHNLNDSLSSVSQLVEYSIKSSECGTSGQLEATLSLQQQFKVFSHTISQATSLRDLQQQSQQQIEHIAHALRQKSRREEAEQKNLRRQLLSMQARVEDVENEADTYQQRLDEQKLRSLQDGLTRLPNQAAYEQRIQLEYQRWQSYASPLSVAVVRIDNFQHLVDAYGARAGDRTLQVIANMLKKSLRPADFVCRYAAEDFVIIFPQSRIGTASDILEKSRNRIKNIPFKFKNKHISITISAGIASFTAEDTHLTVFKRAGAALGEATEQGHDRICNH